MAAKPPITTVDEYFDTLPDATKPKFAELRALLNEAAPGAKEAISYNMCALKDDGDFIYFLGARKHVSLFTAPTDEPSFEADIAPYLSGKATLQFALDKALPVELITRVVQYRRQWLKDTNAEKAAAEAEKAAAKSASRSAGKSNTKKAN